MSMKPQQSKLKNTKVANHESDTNYYCTFARPASGGYSWAALIGYTRHKDPVGNTHGWVHFGKGCKELSKEKATLAVFLECFGFEPDSVEDAALPPQSH